MPTSLGGDFPLADRSFPLGHRRRLRSQCVLHLGELISAVAILIVERLAKRRKLVADSCEVEFLVGEIGIAGSPVFVSRGGPEFVFHLLPTAIPENAVRFQLGGPFVQFLGAGEQLSVQSVELNRLGSRCECFNRMRCRFDGEIAGANVVPTGAAFFGDESRP